MLSSDPNLKAEEQSDEEDQILNKIVAIRIDGLHSTISLQ
jgi:hypothetical protein